MTLDSSKLANVTKEKLTFQKALCFYNSKFYKKSLATLESIKCKQNDELYCESQALKACIYFFLNKKKEGREIIENVLIGREDNYIINRFAYNFYINTEDYIKSEHFMLKMVQADSLNDSNYLNLISLQLQNKNYLNLVSSSKINLKNQPGYKHNWIILSIAYYLNNNFKNALSVLQNLYNLLGDNELSDEKYENSEHVLYKIMLHMKLDENEKALELINKHEIIILDKSKMLEMKGEVLMKLNKKKEASLVYRMLLKRNPDNSSFYLLLEKSLDIENRSLDDKLRLYLKLSETYSDSIFPKINPLFFLPYNHESFKELLKNYFLECSKKKIFSVIINLKKLYRNKKKVKIIEEISLNFLKSNDEKGLNNFENSYFFFLLSFHFKYSNCFEKALNYVDKCLDINPKCIDFLLLKSKILKLLNNTTGSSELVNESRKLDLQDRSLNLKTCKYYLKCNKIEESIKTFSLFLTKEENYNKFYKNLDSVQAIRFYLITAINYFNLYYYENKDTITFTIDKMSLTDKENCLEKNDSNISQLNIELYKCLSLKLFHHILSFFKIFKNNLFDFHIYCIKNGTILTYLDMIEWSENMFFSPVYLLVLEYLTKIYINIYNEQEKYNKANECEKKHYKALFKKNKKIRSNLLNKSSINYYKLQFDDDDDDVLGFNFYESLTKLNVIDELFEFYKPLISSNLKRKSVYENLVIIYLKQKKHILSFQSIRNLDKLLNPNNHLKLKLIGKFLISLYNECVILEDENVKKIIMKGIKTSFPDFDMNKIENNLKIYLD